MPCTITAGTNCQGDDIHTVTETEKKKLPFSFAKPSSNEHWSKITLSVDLREPRATNSSGDPETGVLWVLGSKRNVELEKLVKNAEGGSRVRPATRRHNKSPMRDSPACRKDLGRRREVSHAISQTCFGLVPCDRFSTRTVPLL